MFFPDGQQVLTASSDNNLKLWSAASGECVRTLQAFTRAVWSAVFSPNGQQVFTPARDNIAKLRSGLSEKVVRNLNGHRGVVLSAVFSPDGQQVLTASKDGTAKLWSAASGQSVHTLGNLMGLGTLRIPKCCSLFGLPVELGDLKQLRMQGLPGAAGAARIAVTHVAPGLSLRLDSSCLDGISSSEIV